MRARPLRPVGNRRHHNSTHSRRKRTAVRAHRFPCPIVTCLNARHSSTCLRSALDSRWSFPTIPIFNVELLLQPRLSFQTKHQFVGVYNSVPAQIGAFLLQSCSASRVGLISYQPRLTELLPRCTSPQTQRGSARCFVLFPTCA